MNRSFRAPESQMKAPLQQRQGRNFGTVMKEKEEELALFLEMRRREKERNSLLFMHSPDEFDAPLGSKPGSSPIFKIMSSTPPRKTATDDFLNSEGEKNDYDWLLTPPGTPLFPCLDTELNKSTIMSQIGTPKARPTALKSRLANPQMEAASRGNGIPRPSSAPSLNSSNVGIRRPSSSGGPVSAGSRSSRPATPTGRSLVPATSRSSRPSTPTSRPTLQPSSKSTVPSTRPTLQPSSKSTVPSTRPSATAVARSATAVARSATAVARSATPTTRTAVPPSKAAVRSATPTRHPSITSSSMGTIGRSSSVSKTAPPPSTKTMPSRGTSPTVKSRPWKPSEMPGFSLDAPPNLRTSMPERPLSASRGRPGVPSSRSSSVEPTPNGRPRRQSCSPSRGRAPNGSIHSNGSSISSANRARSNSNDNPSPVLIGTKMVERVINMRKLVPPKHDEPRSSPNNPAGKQSSSPDSSGFGRNLSKKSLDMALRHMDIRRTIPSSLRPLMTNIPASSVYSVRSGAARSRAVSVSDSPIATSSNCSSERSVDNNLYYLYGSEHDDDVRSDRGGQSSPSSLRGR